MKQHAKQQACFSAPSYCLSWAVLGKKKRRWRVLGGGGVWTEGLFQEKSGTNMLQTISRKLYSRVFAATLDRGPFPLALSSNRNVHRLPVSFERLHPSTNPPLNQSLIKVGRALEDLGTGLYKRPDNQIVILRFQELT